MKSFIIFVLSVTFGVIFFTGCGGGGGNSDSNIIPTIENSFPPFSETVNNSVRTKQHVFVSQQDANNLLAGLDLGFSINVGLSLTDFHNDNYTFAGNKYATNGLVDDCSDAYLKCIVDLSVASTEFNTNVGPNIFDAIYGNINGEVSILTYTVGFFEDKTTFMNQYAAKLQEKEYGFTCSGTGCEKVTSEYIFKWGSQTHTSQYGTITDTYWAIHKQFGN